MHRLVGQVRDYAWGSTSSIARLQGREPSGRPEAELWLGAHPGAPSTVEPVDGSPVPLNDLIAADPEIQLGAATASAFDGQLPFLLKILAAAEPLSLQAHPSSVQAIEGFERENELGVPIDAPERSFRDRSHKPELICALTEFWALCGFREQTASSTLLSSLPVDGKLDPLIELVGSTDGLERGLRHLLTRDSTEAADLSNAVADACRDVADGPFVDECRWAARLATAYPGDVGVVTSLLLNLVCLAPGEALFLEAGNLHMYLDGTGVEIMASSDNVLRGGLTPKHIDIPALLDVVIAEPLPLDVQRPDVIDGRARYRSPVPEFALERLEVGATADPLMIEPVGPEILLCVLGQTRSTNAHGALELAAGQSLFLNPSSGPIALSGDGTVFRAWVDGH